MDGCGRLDAHAPRANPSLLFPWMRAVLDTGVPPYPCPSHLYPMAVKCALALPLPNSIARELLGRWHREVLTSFLLAGTYWVFPRHARSAPLRQVTRRPGMDGSMFVTAS